MGIPERLHSSQLFQYGYYLRVFDNVLTNSVNTEGERKYLYSFVGRKDNCPKVRGAILNLPSDMGFLADRSNAQTDNDESYVDVMDSSQFVLCPRGIGPSTWRAYEAMSAGRVPVIISDEWYPPQGPDWDVFAVIIREDEIDSIPVILESLQHKSKIMGERARTAWQQHFSVESAFNWIGDTLTHIQKNRQDEQGGSIWPLAMKKAHFKHVLKEYIRFRLKKPLKS